MLPLLLQVQQWLLALNACRSHFPLTTHEEVVKINAFLHEIKVKMFFSLPKKTLF